MNLYKLLSNQSKIVEFLLDLMYYLLRINNMVLNFSYRSLIYVFIYTLVHFSDLLLPIRICTLFGSCLTLISFIHEYSIFLCVCFTSKRQQKAKNMFLDSLTGSIILQTFQLEKLKIFLFSKNEYVKQFENIYPTNLVLNHTVNILAVLPIVHLLFVEWNSVQGI